MRNAIRTAIESYESLPAKGDGVAPGRRQRWVKDLKPIFNTIVDKDEWPAGCAFDGSYGLVDSRKVKYEGLGLRIYVQTPNAERAGFALPVIDLFLGRFCD